MMSSTKLLAIGAAFCLGLFACTQLPQTPLKSQTSAIQRQAVQPVMVNPRADLEKIGAARQNQAFSELKKPLVFQSRDASFGLKAEGCCNDTSEQRPNTPLFTKLTLAKSPLPIGEMIRPRVRVGTSGTAIIFPRARGWC